jgi:transcriptional regulator with XRE-family HTH domain
MTPHEILIFYKMLGERIREARINAGLKQEAFAGFLHLSRVSIVNIEKGRQHPPIHLLWDISKLLNIEVFDLLPKIELQDETPEKWKKLVQKQPINDKKTQEKLLGFIGEMKSAKTKS